MVHLKKQQQQQHTFALVVDHTLDRLEALPLVRDVEGLKDVREGRIVPTNPADGSLQVEEALLLQRTWSAPLTLYHTKKCSSQNPYKACQGGWILMKSIIFTLSRGLRRFIKRSRNSNNHSILYMILRFNLGFYLHINLDQRTYI